jgi:hypothetical protein
MTSKQFEANMRLAEIGTANFNNGKRVVREQIEKLMRDIVADLEEVKSTMHGHPELARENYQFLFGKRTALNGVLDRLRVLLSQSERVSAEKGTVTRGDEGERS